MPYRSRRAKTSRWPPDITDSNLAEEFRRYHAEVAALDFVTTSANLAQAARHRIRPTRIQLT